MLHTHIFTRLLPLLLLAATFFTDLHAQTAWGGFGKRQRKGLAQTNATLLRQTAALDSLIARYRNWQYEGTDTLSNPYYASLFGSPTLYGSALNRQFAQTGGQGERRTMLPSSARVYDITTLSDRYLLNAYAAYPWFVQHEEAEQGTLDMERQIRESAKPEKTLTERFAEKEEATATPPPLPLDDDLGIVVRKPNFWTFKANLSFQFTQNYVSDNWYKGGESNVAFLASTILEANYNNQQKLTFDNKLEMKLGFQTSHNDDEHKFKTNSDLIRLTNKLGLKAVKHWSYTAMLQSWTQFYRGYKSNDPKIYSDFMSPFESLLSIGMDYQMTTKNSKFKINATLSPLALKLKYVDRPSLITTFGLSEGHKSKWDWGSNVTINYTWNMIKNVSWSGRIYWFTDYSKTQIEWENTFNLTINKYLSAKLFLYPRFDDSVTRDEGESYFQFNELLSLGLNVNF